jgi:hypothetical protein
MNLTSTSNPIQKVMLVAKFFSGFEQNLMNTRDYLRGTLVFVHYLPTKQNNNFFQKLILL